MLSEAVGRGEVALAQGCAASTENVLIRLPNVVLEKGIRGFGNKDFDQLICSAQPSAMSQFVGEANAQALSFAKFKRGSSTGIHEICLPDGARQFEAG